VKIVSAFFLLSRAVNASGMAVVVCTQSGAFVVADFSVFVTYVHERLRMAALQQSARVMPSNFERCDERMASSF
jgi:hypothetical protein